MAVLAPFAILHHFVCMYVCVCMCVCVCVCVCVCACVHACVLTHETSSLSHELKRCEVGGVCVYIFTSVSSRNGNMGMAACVTVAYTFVVYGKLSEKS